MRKPDFFIVGAPKSGTTALYRYLRPHPDIFMPSSKELHYFGSDLDIRFGATRKEDDYLAHFRQAKDEKRVGEASVWYLYSQKAAAEIYTFCPAARIIIMLRNPVDMLYSQHSQFLYNGNEDIVDFAEALAAESDRKQGRRIPPETHFTAALFYRETAEYAEQVKRYFDIFDPDQVRIILFDDFRTDTAGVYRQTLQFLDVADDFQADFRVVNPNKRARSKALRRVLNRPPAWARRLVPKPFRQGVRRQLKQWNTNYQSRQPIDPVLRRQLQAEFAPEVLHVSELIGRDLSHWSDAD